jgi:tetratricopeptide (TPR) repeat protein
MLGIIAALFLSQALSAPPAFDALVQQAVNARDSGHLDDALALYQKALKLRPDWDEGLWDAGSVAYDKDRFTDCAPLFRRLTAIKPALAPAWIMSGLCEYGLHQYPRSLESLLQAEQLHFEGPPELARAARLHLALVLIKTGTFEKAIVLLTELTRMDHKTQEISIAAGIAGLRKPWTPAEVPASDREKVAQLGDAMSTVMELDAKGAVPKFEAVVQAFPDDPNIHFRFGSFLLQQSPDRGIAEIKRTLELDPAHVPALVGLASVYQRNGDVKSAVEYSFRAVQAAPGDFATHIVYGRALMDDDDVVGATAQLETAARLAPDSADAHYSLAAAYSRLGRKDDAKREQDEFRRLRKIIDAAHP